MRLISLSILVGSLSLSLLSCQHARQETSDESRPQYNPKAAEIHVELGLAYLNQGSRERAKEKLLLALQEHPTSVVVNDAYAYFCEVTGDLSKAEYYYQAALKQEPHSGIALNNYGTYFCRNKNYERSIEYFLQATDDPSYLNVAEAYENAGLCAKQIPDVKRAQRFFEHALKQDPRRETSLLALAQILNQQGQTQLAQSYLSQYESLTQTRMSLSELSKQRIDL